MMGAISFTLSIFASASEPSDQNEIDLASGLSAIEISNPATALKSADVAIPIMTSCKALRESEKVIKVASKAPIAAAIAIERDPMVATLRTTAVAAPRVAPAEVPMMDGSASGLLVADCASAPDAPRAKPINSAARILGNLIPQMISWLGPEIEGWKMNFQGDSIATLPILNEKRVKPAMKNMITIKRIRRPLTLIIS